MNLLNFTNAVVIIPPLTCLVGEASLYTQCRERDKHKVIKNAYVIKTVTVVSHHNRSIAC